MKANLSLLLLLVCMKVMAQTGTIKGTVNTSDGRPAEFVNVSLQGTAKGAISNAKGEYLLEKAPAGSYTLIASYVGLVTQRAEITVRAGETVTANFTLAESDAQLQEVVVQGNVNKFADKKTEYVARMPLKNLENPQVYSMVSKELMKEQMMTEIKEALRAGPGVVPSEYVTGSFTMFYRGFTSWNYVRNGLTAVTQRTGTEIANLERIELIKGPSTTLFGPGSAQYGGYGGVTNLVTKKPFSEFGGSAGYSAGSFNLSRATVDVNTPLNKDKTLLFRINAVNHRQNSSNEYGKSKRYLIAPSLSYQVNGRLSVLFDFEYYKSQSTRLAATFFDEAATFRSLKDTPLPLNESYFANDMLSEDEATKFFGTVNYKLGDKWTSVTAFSNVSEFVTGSYQPYIDWLDNTTAIKHVRLFGPRENNSVNIQQNFNGSFNTGSIRHNMLIGLSYENNVESAYYKISPTLDTIYAGQPYVKKGIAEINKILADTTTVSDFYDYGYSSSAVYISDVINWTDKLSTMLSLRLDRYQEREGTYSDKYMQVSFSPKLGVVYQLIKDRASLFANYMSGYQNRGPGQQPDGSLFRPRPEFANQWEGGIKTELSAGKLSGSISYYNIAIDNAIREDDRGFQVQDGKQVSRGLEVELIASPAKGLSIISGYGFNENKIIKADSYEGKFATGAPQHIVNYWISYKVPGKSLNGLGFGVGGNYISNSYDNASNTRLTPSHHVVNSTLFYEKSKWRAGLKLNNIGNVQYWDLAGNTQFTRNFVVTYSFMF